MAVAGECLAVRKVVQGVGHVVGPSIPCCSSPRPSVNEEGDGRGNLADREVRFSPRRAWLARARNKSLTAWRIRWCGHPIQRRPSPGSPPTSPGQPRRYVRSVSGRRPRGAVSSAACRGGGRSAQEIVDVAGPEVVTHEPMPGSVRQSPLVLDNDQNGLEFPDQGFLLALLDPPRRPHQIAQRRGRSRLVARP